MIQVTDNVVITTEVEQKMYVVVSLKGKSATIRMIGTKNDSCDKKVSKAKLQKAELRDANESDFKEGTQLWNFEGYPFYLRSNGYQKYNGSECWNAMGVRGSKAISKTEMQHYKTIA